MNVTKKLFGSMPDGDEVYEYTVSSDNGFSFSAITLGATVRTFIAPDKNGDPVDVVLGFDSVEDYLTKSNYQGATVGRYANRIGGGEFVLNGKKYALTKNEKDRTCLHSAGELSFVNWKAVMPDSDSVEFSCVCRDGNEGFPGNIDVTVRMTLDDDGALTIAYRAVPDAETYINLTNHSYFDLNGFASGDILSHELCIDASAFTPVDEYSIPTGEIRPVDGTPFDFRQPKPIGRDIDLDDEQLLMTGGFDHNFCLDCDGSLKKIASAVGDKSGIKMDVYTTLPAVQFYAGNFLKGAPGKDGVPMTKRTAFCLETQYYPDSPNRPDFPSCLFSPDRPYESTTVYALGTV